VTMDMGTATMVMPATAMTGTAAAATSTGMPMGDMEGMIGGCKISVSLFDLTLVTSLPWLFLLARELSVKNITSLEDWETLTIRAISNTLSGRCYGIGTPLTHASSHPAGTSHRRACLLARVSASSCWSCH
jgi:hypothetical protein